MLTGKSNQKKQFIGDANTQKKFACRRNTYFPSDSKKTEQ